MNRHIFIVAITLAGFSVTAGPAPGMRSKAISCAGPIITSNLVAENYIRKSEEEWASSVATNDSSVVSRILADDFVWVLNGRVLNKKVAVEEAATGPGSFLSNAADYVHVRFFGKTAVAQGSETWTKTGGRKGQFIWTDTWINRSGCWQIVNAQDTVVTLSPR